MAMAAGSVDVRVLESTPQRIVLEYALGGLTEGSVQIDGRKYTQLTLDKEGVMLIKGAPALPFVCRSIVIPHDEMAVNVLEARYYDLAGINVAPSKGNLLRTQNPEEVPWEFGAVYKTDAFWPAPLARLGEPYTLRDYRGMVVQLNPLQYNPVTRTLRVYTEVTLEVVPTGSGAGYALHRPLRDREVSLAFHQIYTHQFLNYAPELRYVPLNETGDMLIICYDAWLTNVQPLVDHKNSIGIDTTAVGVSTIPGGTTAAAIKSYIQSVYAGGELAFVLLVGDSAQVATPTASSGSSDPTYSKMDGDNYPDILVGRFSAETPAHVDTQVQRTIEYEQMPATEQAWFKRGTGIGSAEGAGIGDDGEADYVHIGNIRTDLLGYGYTVVDQVYDPGATAAQVSTAMNAGRGIVNYCGHGSTTAWSTTGFSNSNVNALLNDNMLPFIISVACVNGQFAGYTCFAEAWLRALHGGEPIGAIATYMSSINQSWAPPMAAQDESVDLLVAEAYFSFGALCFAGSCRMMDEYGSGGVDMFNTWHVFGDPSVRVFGTAAQPTGLKVTPAAAFESAGPLGGPFTPGSMVYTLENQNDTGMNYSVSRTQAWVSLDNTGGYLSPHATAAATVSINSVADGLADGHYTDTVTFINTTDHDGDTTRGVALQVGGPQLFHNFPLDTNPGWSVQGQWAFGDPTGGGSHGLDPNTGHTGNNVYGYNLNGDYTNSMPAYYLTTTALNCSDLTDVELRFWKWLGVESST
ncbi:MAG: C25 family cysteine peptidase, partial [Planctomycetota bacterium]